MATTVHSKTVQLLLNTVAVCKFNYNENATIQVQQKKETAQQSQNILHNTVKTSASHDT